MTELQMPRETLEAFQTLFIAKIEKDQPNVDERLFAALGRVSYELAKAREAENEPSSTIPRA